MQFDPGLEYKPNRGGGESGLGNALAPSSVTGVGGQHGSGGQMVPSTIPNKDDPSWLLLCGALTDGPYSSL